MTPITSATSRRVAVMTGGWGGVGRQADEHALAALFDVVEERFGGVDVAVHSAGALSKRAIGALTSCLARELHGRDVTARAVAPGLTATDFFLVTTDHEAVDCAAAQSSLGSLGTPEDGADRRTPASGSASRRPMDRPVVRDGPARLPAPRQGAAHPHLAPGEPVRLAESRSVPGPQGGSITKEEAS